MYTREMSSRVIRGGGAPWPPPPPPPETARGTFWGTGNPSRSGPATWSMKYVPDAFATPPEERMSRLGRETGAGSVSGTLRLAQSANRPSITITEGAAMKYASRSGPAIVMGRGPDADWRDTETTDPAGKAVAVTETATVAEGVAAVRGTCERDGVTVTPLVAVNVKEPTSQISPCGIGPTAAMSRRRAAVVPDGSALTRGTCRIRIAPKVAANATLVWDVDPSKSSAASRIVDALGEKEAKSSVDTRNSRVDPEAAAGVPAPATRPLPFTSALAGSS